MQKYEQEQQELLARDWGDMEAPYDRRSHSQDSKTRAESSMSSRASTSSLSSLYKVGNKFSLLKKKMFP